VFSKRKVSRGTLIQGPVPRLSCRCPFFRWSTDPVSSMDVCVLFCDVSVRQWLWTCHTTVKARPQLCTLAVVLFNCTSCLIAAVGLTLLSALHTTRVHNQD